MAAFRPVLFVAVKGRPQRPSMSCVHEVDRFPLFFFLFSFFCSQINAAQRLRVAANEKAEAEKILQVKRAEGDAEAKYLAGVGVARQRQAIVDGLRESVLAFADGVPGTTPKDVMDMVRAPHEGAPECPSWAHLQSVLHCSFCLHAWWRKL